MIHLSSSAYDSYSFLIDAKNNAWDSQCTNFENYVIPRLRYQPTWVFKEDILC